MWRQNLWSTFQWLIYTDDCQMTRFALDTFRCIQNINNQAFMTALAVFVTVLLVFVQWWKIHFDHSVSMSNMLRDCQLKFTSRFNFSSIKDKHTLYHYQSFLYSHREVNYAYSHTDMWNGYLMEVIIASTQNCLRFQKCVYSSPVSLRVPWQSQWRTRNRHRSTTRRPRHAG